MGNKGYTSNKDMRVMIARRLGLQFSIEIEQEIDGRWIAEIPEVPGALAYGVTVDESIAKAYEIAVVMR
jgi:hypothetical protein